MTAARQAAVVLERLLVDPQFRASFRVAPAATLDHHGLPEVAQRLRGDQRALQTLELRESRSSLAGVLMAAAVEGVALFDAVGRQARPLDPEAAEAMRHALARPAVQRLTAAMPAAGAAAATPDVIGAASPGAPPVSSAPAVAGPAGAAAPGIAAAVPAVPPPAVPGPPALPGASDPSDAAGSMPVASAPAVPGVPGQSAVPGTPIAPAAPGAPAVPGSPGASAMPGVPAVPAVPGVPAVSGAPSAPAIPGSLAVPNAAGSMPVATASGAGAARTGIGAAARLDQPPEPPAADPGDAAADVDLDYPGDDAPKAEIAAWMGAAAKKAGLPPELPVMAALQESSLRNLSGGDADSAGFFQMREQYWDSGEYRGYRNHPELQLKWFIDHALKEKAAHPELTRSPSSYGEWIANVERPAAEHRGKYQPHLGEARQLLAAGENQPQAAEAADVDTPASVPGRLLKIAAKELGIHEDPPGSNDAPRIAQYRTAGPPAGVGPWCAYFVSWVSRRAGVPLGDQGFASVDALWAWAEQTGRAVHSPKPGDLVVWDEHVGIVERVDADGTLHTIEGNTSDQVARRTHTPAGVIGYVRLTRGR